MLTYTTIQHEFRKANQLSCLEYVLLDIIYHLSVDPDAKIKGWCYARKEVLADEIGITRQGLHKMLERLINLGFVLKDDETSYLKTTSKWGDVYRKPSLHDVNLVYTERKQSLHGTESHLIINNNNTDNHYQYNKQEKSQKYFVGGRPVENLKDYYEKKFQFSVEELCMKYDEDHYNKCWELFLSEHLEKPWRDDQDLKNHFRNFCRTQSRLKPEPTKDKFNQSLQNLSNGMEYLKSKYENDNSI
jgi:hypothetical protein